MSRLKHDESALSPFAWLSDLHERSARSVPRAERNGAHRQPVVCRLTGLELSVRAETLSRNDLGRRRMASARPKAPRLAMYDAVVLGAASSTVDDERAHQAALTCLAA
ncbi:hypothetical protein [Methylobacterium organophilum]|uniref:hypothetical protein n=1 Tax=Methylobacterium organophilum TaxID=410 RepID=UPI001EE2F6F0|nr:hypothetical protein [Methylobacterium organophilum]